VGRTGGEAYEKKRDPNKGKRKEIAPNFEGKKRKKGGDKTKRGNEAHHPDT